MASFIGTQEVHDVATAGSISRHGAIVTTRTLNQAAGVAEGLLLAPSGTAGLECISPSTTLGVRQSVGFSVYRPMSEDFDSTHHYADNEAVAVMEEGHMNVLCEGTAVANRPVLARITSDGGDNTVLGKVSAVSDYPAGGIVLTPVAVVASDSNHYSVTLYDGQVRETYSFNTDVTPSAQELVEGLAALINAGTAFDATEDNSALSITSVTGILEVDAGAQFTITNPARCVIVPGAFFDASRTGAGLVEIRLNKQN